MGRLFWKFFLFFWLAQIVTSLGVGVAIWALRPDHPEHRDRPPPPPAMAQPGAGERPLPPPPRPRDDPPPRWMPPLMPLVAGSVVSVLFAGLLAAYFARPIRSLHEAFGAAAAGRLDTRIGASMGQRRDELANLGSDFDRMAGRLQTVIDGQRRLLHDVSHELRSPLARLQAAADLLRQQPERADEFIDRIERDTARMDQLVGELLTLARLDAGRPVAADETVDLGALLGDIVGDARIEAEQRQVALVPMLDETVTVSGNAELLRRAIENVLRNGLRHSPAQGRIDIRLDRAGESARIEIADQGPGVADSERASIFEPFYRTTTASAFGGFGLGLAIARRVAEVHGGSIVAANRPSGGLAVTLTLPTAKT